MFFQNVGVSGDAVRCESRAWKFARRFSAMSPISCCASTEIDFALLI